MLHCRHQLRPRNQGVRGCFRDDLSSPECFHPHPAAQGLQADVAPWSPTLAVNWRYAKAVAPPTPTLARLEAHAGRATRELRNAVERGLSADERLAPELPNLAPRAAARGAHEWLAGTAQTGQGSSPASADTECATRRLSRGDKRWRAATGVSLKTLYNHPRTCAVYGSKGQAWTEHDRVRPGARRPIGPPPHSP